MDFGVGVNLNESLKLGFSLINVGSITWSGNVFTANNDTLLDMESGGFNSYNIFFEAENIAGDEGVMDWEGLQNKKVALPTMMRIGSSYIFGGEDKKADIGFDFILPLNQAAGNVAKPVFALGGDFRPVKWLDISSGFRLGGNYGFNIPLGVDFVIGDGTWEAGVATRDIVTYFSQRGPTLSMAMGFLRFRF